MLISFREDFTDNVVLDNQLKGTPDSGLYWNQGVHPLITTKNILQLTPFDTIVFNDWDSLVNYGVYEDSRSKNDIVLYNGLLYQSLSINLNSQPDLNTSDWLLTNIESLRIKMLIQSSKESMISDCLLQSSIIENQYIYSSSKNDVDLPNNYNGWVFEPKGSDYVKIRINEICLTANTNTPQSLYVINQGKLIDTLTLNPQNGNLVFEDLDYTISGKGRFTFLFNSQNVRSDSEWNDTLKYSGFVAYPVTAKGDILGGDIPFGDDITFYGSNNGLHFNVTAFRDSNVYIENNIFNLSRLWQLRFAFDFMKIVLNNPYVQSNLTERGLKNETTALEAMDYKSHTVVKQYKEELKRVRASIEKTFDKFTKSTDAKKLKFKRTVV